MNSKLTKEQASSPTETKVGKLNAGENSPVVFDKITSFKALYKATQNCRKGVRWKDSVASFTNHSLMHVYKLNRELVSNTYKIQRYSQFYVFEPKKRLITATRFRDRVFQRSLCNNYLYEELTKDFLPTNCACQIGKGTHYALNKLKAMYREFYQEHGLNGWVLKCDLSDFFGSTKHWVAKEAIRKRIDDDYAISKVNEIIDSFDCGIGLGSQVSQLIQLAVLDGLDHYLVEELKFERYVRYMDDFILISENKESLQNARVLITEYLSKFELNLSPKKTQIFKITQPMTFLGFTHKLWTTGKLTRKYPPSKEKKQRRKLKVMIERARDGKLTIDDIERSYQSWRSNCQKSNSRGRMLKMDKYFNELKRSLCND